jgi:apolipoprotein D and lipocalin family protein
MGMRLAGVGLLAGMVAGPVALGQAVTAVPQLDLNRFTGTWYEMARYPDKGEKTCVSDAVMLYALGDKAGKFQMVSSCQMKDGNTNWQSANGRITDKKVADGRLKVTYIWPFTHKDWVLAVGPEYEWALVGSPKRKEMWVLSRSVTMAPEVLAAIEDKAVAEGFEKGKMVAVAQTAGRRR